jgi:ankyrin repeat protein
MSIFAHLLNDTLKQNPAANPKNEDATDLLTPKIFNEMRREADLESRRGSAAAFLLSVWPQGASARERADATFLREACALNLPECVDCLLAMGSDPRGAQDGITPAMAAARAGSVESLRALMDWFAKRREKLPNDRDGHGLQAVHWAAKNGQAAALEMLLIHDPSQAWALDNAGNTPAMWAARAGSQACLEAIARHGGERPAWNASSKDGFTALSCAVVKRSLGCCEFLGGLLADMARAPEFPLRKIAQHALKATRQQANPLSIAVSLSEAAICAAIAPAAMAALPDKRDRQKHLNEWLALAAVENHLGVNQVIQTWKACESSAREGAAALLDPTARAFYGALFAAAAGLRDKDAAADRLDSEVLMESFKHRMGMSPAATRHALMGAVDQSTAWHQAAIHNAHHSLREMARALDPETASLVALRRDSEGLTPLAAAAKAGHWQACESLQTLGEARPVADALGRSPFMHAVAAGSLRLARLLDYSIPADQADSLAADQLRAKTRPSFDGATPASVAARMGRVDLLEWILEGSDPKMALRADERGETALHCCARGAVEALLDRSQGSTDPLVCLRLLLDSGLDPNARNHQGFSALDLACQAGWRAGAALLAPLADSSHDQKGRSPLAGAIALPKPDLDTVVAVAQWIDPRTPAANLRPDGSLGPSRNASEQAYALGRPALAQTLAQIQTLWDHGVADGAREHGQDLRDAQAAAKLAQSAELFRQRASALIAHARAPRKPRAS